jgi:hypothetical protein
VVAPAANHGVAAPSVKEAESAAHGLAYPAPTLVVGVGRFGLAALERLGESWSWLRDAGEDRSVNNLGLVHLGARDDGDLRWRNVDKEAVQRAAQIGSDDEPSAALDFAILRSIGLIRCRDGTYEVGVPCDPGNEWVFVPRGEEAGIASGRDDSAGHGDVRNYTRVRYFVWRALDPDPLRAPSILRRRIEREMELQQFVAPILSRVRRGHSPQAILASVARCRAHAEGRDPSPWRWQARPEWAADLEKDPWHEFVGRDAPGKGRDGQIRVPNGACDPIAFENDRSLLNVPDPFKWVAGDAVSPLDPIQVLAHPWEVQGWTTHASSATQTRRYDVARLGWGALGLFDHADTKRFPMSQAPERLPPAERRLRDHLKKLGEYVYRGLVALFVDMRATRVTEYDVPVFKDASVIDEDAAIDQSLNLLGEFFTRPQASMAGKNQPGVAAASAQVGAAVTASVPAKARGVEPALSNEPTAALRRLALLVDAKAAGTAEILDARLRTLGLRESPPEGEAETRLLQQVLLDAPPKEKGDADLTALARVINEQVGRMLSLEHLSTYRRDLHRAAPRVTVYLVVDLSEPFARATLRGALGVIHAELQRTYGAVFQTFKTGFQRTLSVVPILWTPPPATAASNADPPSWTLLGEPEPPDISEAMRRADVNRSAEAAILDALFNFRRRIEEMPRSLRCVPQIYVNSRVTEHSVLSVSDAARQTHDFISLESRSDTAADKWLRCTAVGPFGRDFLATFSCIEIDLPGERAREYLANRLARASLAHVCAPITGDREPGQDVGKGEHTAQAQAERVVEDLGRRASGAGKEANETVTKCTIDEGTTASEVAREFGPEMVTNLHGRLRGFWQQVTRPGGELDAGFARYRASATRDLGKEGDLMLRRHDDVVHGLAHKRLLHDVLQSFRETLIKSRTSYEKAARDRSERERVALREGIPGTEAVASACDSVVEAGRRKPDRKPIQLGVVALAIMAPALAAPVLHGVAVSTDLWRHPNMIEWLIGPAGPWVGGAILVAAFSALTRWLLRRRTQELKDAVSQAGDAVARLFCGDTRSVLSFAEARFGLATATTDRGLARKLFEQAGTEVDCARRIDRSLQLQRAELGRRAEELGVQPDLEAADGRALRDEVSHLFSVQRGDRDALIRPQDVVSYYLTFMGSDEDGAGDLTGRLFERAGGFDQWRSRAVLADTNAVLDVGRERFAEIARPEVVRHPVLSPIVAANLESFVKRCYSTIGFAASVTGFEGLDTDSNETLADATLIVGEALHWLLPERAIPEGQIRVVPALRPGAAYMVSIIHGISPDGASNLQRYESFHERQSFPGNPSTASPDRAPLTIVSGYEDEIGVFHEKTGDYRRIFVPPPASEAPSASKPPPAPDTPGAPRPPAGPGPKKPEGGPRA